MGSIPLTDVNVNVHAMFRDNDTMLVRNDPNILEIQQDQVSHRLIVTLAILLGAPALLLVVTLMLASIL